VYTSARRPEGGGGGGNQNGVSETKANLGDKLKWFHPPVKRHQWEGQRKEPCRSRISGPLEKGERTVISGCGGPVMKDVNREGIGEKGTFLLKRPASEEQKNGKVADHCGPT